MTTKNMAENNKYVGTEKKFTFHFLPDRKFICYEDNCKDLLIKWSLLDNMSIQSFSFDEKFRSYMLNDFVWSFFQDPVVLQSLQVYYRGSSISVSTAATEVEIESVPATLTSMNFFNRLYDNKIARTDGSIVKCYEDYIDEIYIADELRKMLMIEESDNYDMFTPIERREFLFRLFAHLCLGGNLCQYEDYINDYLNVAKQMYKDIVNVQKDPETKEIRVISIIAKVNCYNDNVKYYPSSYDHLQNFAYLIIDPIKQHVNVFSHVWN
ncbi:uncharacterized protein C11orf70 homolog [Centruroides sculpturatus]|uniref:uncharacterized protein C11orf70 homolog n=1 Tax=Centruroides sculpturatus TaxID=218467 RepID=UPI000C6CDB7F|nr:uncharacterized protein C11orf70 homolog [Centruroides sculpturatus]